MENNMITITNRLQVAQKLSIINFVVLDGEVAVPCTCNPL